MTDPHYTMDPNFVMHTTQRVPTEPVTPVERKQVGGDHYNKHKMQPFDIIDEYGLNFYEGNVLKYLLRWRDKNGSEDLLKAKHYLEELITRVQEGICE